MTKRFDTFVNTVLESNSFADLPNSPPYGFWISPGGDFTVVKYQSHGQAALGIIRKSEILSKELAGKNLVFRDAINELSRRKYVRVTIDAGNVYAADVFYYDMENSFKSVRFTPTNQSLRTLNDICEFYNKTIEYVYD